jgi:hypothetical protein
MAQVVSRQLVTEEAPFRARMCEICGEAYKLALGQVLLRVLKTLARQYHSTAAPYSRYHPGEKQQARWWKQLRDKVASDPMMEAVRTSKTSVYLNETTRRYILESSHLHTRRRENLKSHNGKVYLQAYVVHKSVLF